MLRNDKHLNKCIYTIKRALRKRNETRPKQHKSDATGLCGETISAQVSPDQIIISSDVHIVPDCYGGKTAEELLIDPPLWSKDKM